MRRIDVVIRTAAAAASFRSLSVPTPLASPGSPAYRPAFSQPRSAVRRLDGVSGSRRRQVICFSLEEQAAPSNRSFYVEEYYARTPIAL